jgi:hypothetical protein
MMKKENYQGWLRNDVTIHNLDSFFGNIIFKKKCNEIQKVIQATKIYKKLDYMIEIRYHIKGYIASKLHF